MSAQPTSCLGLWDAIRFVHQRGGTARRQELLAHLVRSGLGVSNSGGIVQMLSNYNFVRKEEKTDGSSVLALQDWVVTLSNQFRTKGDVMIILCAGIVSGGRGASEKTKKANEAESNSGTRLILSGLQSLRRRGKTSPSLTELAIEIEEKQMAALYLICGLLDIPSEGDPYSLGVVHMIGKMSKHESTTVTLNPEVLHSYQISIMSRYLCVIIPDSIRKKTGMTFQEALGKKLSSLSADAIRNELTAWPIIWIDEAQRDSLIEDVTKLWGFDWWPEDKRGGGRGLNDDQMKVYVNVVTQPQPTALRIPYVPSR